MSLLTIKCTTCNKTLQRTSLQDLMKVLMHHYSARHPLDLQTLQTTIAGYMEDIAFVCMLDLYDIPEGDNKEETTKAIEVGWDEAVENIEGLISEDDEGEVIEEGEGIDGEEMVIESQEIIVGPNPSRGID